MNNRLVRWTIAIAAGAAALLPLGCGSGASSTQESSAPTKAAFVKQADRICEQTDKTQKAVFNEYFKKHPNAAVSKAVNEEVVSLSLPAVRAEAKQLQALPAPAGDETEVNAFVKAVEEAVEKGEADPGSMVNETAQGPFGEAKKLGQEYGFKACAFPL
jgi:hypothetical protein